MRRKRNEGYDENTGALERQSQPAFEGVAYEICDGYERERHRS